MNYTELTAAVESYEENTFSAADMATFVRQAEQRIYNTVQLPVLRKFHSFVTDTATNEYEFPDDYLAVFSLVVETPSARALLNKDLNFLQEAYPTATERAAPQYYAIVDDYTMRIAPYPNRAYQMTLEYYAYPESIVTAGTTWLGDNFESVLLYGTLMQAHIFLKGETDVYTAYQQQYTEAMAMLKQLGDAKNRRDTYRSGQVRNPVV